MDVLYCTSSELRPEADAFIPKIMACATRATEGIEPAVHICCCCAEKRDQVSGTLID